MKKLILTSATVLFIGLTAFAQDGGKCTEKCEKKCDMKECTRDGNCIKKCGTTICTSDMKCKKGNAKSATCKMDAAEKKHNFRTNK